MFEKTKALCDSFLEMGVPGFDLMVMQDGKCILRYMNGYSDRENKIPMKGDELYNIYSCSKQMTCVAAMQLWEKGLFQLDDLLSDYMPEFKDMTVQTSEGIVKAKTQIHIYDLFQMTAGFDYNLVSPSLKQLRIDTDGRCPTREVARAIAKEPLQFHPGEKYLYSLAHDVLAALVEVLSGEKFEDYVRKHIFEPVGMTHSDFLLPMEEYEKVCQLYIGKDGQVIIDPRGKKPVYRIGTEHASGGAGCASTVEDYIKFLEALRSGETLLKQDTLRLMATQRLNPQQMETFTKKETHGYGLGMRVPKEGGWHKDFGWGGAAGAYFAIDPERKLTIYYAQHVVLAPNVPYRGKIYETVVEELTGETCTNTVLGDAKLTY